MRQTALKYAKRVLILSEPGIPLAGLATADRQISPAALNPWCSSRIMAKARTAGRLWCFCQYWRRALSCSCENRRGAFAELAPEW
jgi:hypothetical protein